MNPAQWNRISEVFAAAAELDAAHRTQLLECEDESVRNEVEGLLVEHQRSGLLDWPVVPRGEENRWSGKTLNGRYRIERFLARSADRAAGQAAHRLPVLSLSLNVKLILIGGLNRDLYCNSLRLRAVSYTGCERREDSPSRSKDKIATRRAVLPIEYALRRITRNH